MDLIISTTSPYARKAQIVRLEKRLHEQIHIVEALPLEESNRSLIQNPLGKVPCLVLSNGEILFDSPVICAYLDSYNENPTLTVREGDERWALERAQALGDGIMDAAFSLVMERRRDDVEQSSFWIERWKKNIAGGLNAMAQDIQARDGSYDIGTISCAVALGYLDFRLPDLDWRNGRDRLAEWFVEQARRASFVDTDYD